LDDGWVGVGVGVLGGGVFWGVLKFV